MKKTKKSKTRDPDRTIENEEPWYWIGILIFFVLFLLLCAYKGWIVG